MEVIMTKYLPATNTKPGRVKAYDGFGNSHTVSKWMAADDVYLESVVGLCKKNNWSGSLSKGIFNNVEVYILDAHLVYVVTPNASEVA